MIDIMSHPTGAMRGDGAPAGMMGNRKMAEIKWITVSVDFKIEEAWRSMARCEAAGRAAGERGNRLDQADWEIYAGQWQAIAISWASR